MLRHIVTKINPRPLLQRSMRSILAPNVRYSSTQETEEQEIDRLVKGFQRPDIDHWWLSMYINEVTAVDSIPDPKVCIACLEACRKLNELAFALRFLEVVRFKCGRREKEVMPYLMQEVGPTMKKLGIPTLEELGMHEPELALPQPHDL